VAAAEKAARVINAKTLGRLPVWLARLCSDAERDTDVFAVDDVGLVNVCVVAGEWSVCCLYRARTRGDGRYSIVVHVEGVAAPPVRLDPSEPSCDHRTADRRLRQALDTLGVRTVRTPRAPPFVGGTSLGKMFAHVADAGGRPPMRLAVALSGRDLRWLAADGDNGRYVVASYLPSTPGDVPEGTEIGGSSYMMRPGQFAFAATAHGRVGLMYRFE
jgi:hypothetical protein